MAKYLHIVPLKFAQIELSVEMLLDITTLSVEEVMGRLKVVERHLVAKGQPRVESVVHPTPLRHAHGLPPGAAQ